MVTINTIQTLLVLEINLFAFKTGFVINMETIETNQTLLILENKRSTVNAGESIQHKCVNK